MAKTRHICKRMSQRGITANILALVEKFGVAQGDKIVLNTKGCRAASESLAKMKRQLDEISETGGYVLVRSGGVDITTYRLNSFRM